jgi:hypothetical protein
MRAGWKRPENTYGMELLSTRQARGDNLTRLIHNMELFSSLPDYAATGGGGKIE